MDQQTITTVNILVQSPPEFPAPSGIKKSAVIFQKEIEPVDRRPRRMTAESLQATELIANAMEYLSDSRELSTGRIIEMDQNHPDVFALLLLMEAKYHVYCSCPVIERRTSTLVGLFKGKERRSGR